jgi:hypothetical protein
MISDFTEDVANSFGAGVGAATDAELWEKSRKNDQG